MSPQRRDPANDANGPSDQRYAVGALLVTLLGVVVLTMGFMVYPPVVPLGMGLGGAAAAFGATHLRRALTATDERAGSTPDEPRAESGRDPVDVLKERYARGDVTDEEFERRLGRLVELDDGESPTDRDGARVPER